MAELDTGVVESVINANFKVIAEANASGIALAGQLSAQNAVAHQNSMNLLREFAVLEATGQRAGIDIAEATAAKKVSEADLARSVSELGSAIAAIQQLMKGAQTTPPVTVPQPAGS